MTFEFVGGATISGLEVDFTIAALPRGPVVGELAGLDAHGKAVLLQR